MKTILLLALAASLSACVTDKPVSTGPGAPAVPNDRPAPNQN